MHRTLPCRREWNGEWCANHLADNSYVQEASTAVRAVEALERKFAHLLSPEEDGPDRHGSLP